MLGDNNSIFSMICVFKSFFAKVVEQTPGQIFDVLGFFLQLDAGG